MPLPLAQPSAQDHLHAQMSGEVGRAVPHSGRLCAYCADVRLWQPVRPPYDLVATHFLLDFLTGEEVRLLAETVRGAISPPALWVVSEFAIPQNSLGRRVAQPVVAGLYLGFRWISGLAVITLPDYPDALDGAGRGMKDRRERLGGLLVSELWTAI